MQQSLNASQQGHILGAVITAATGAFDWLDLGELAFPESQHMRWRIQPFRHFADGPERALRFDHLLAFVAIGNPVFHQMR